MDGVRLPVTSAVPTKFPACSDSLGRPVDTALCRVEGHVLSITGFRSRSYAWKKNGVVIRCINGSAYNCLNERGDSGTYSVVITNCGFSTTASARVQLRNAPLLLLRPKGCYPQFWRHSDREISAGSGLSYQWQKTVKISRKQHSRRCPSRSHKLGRCRLYVYRSQRLRSGDFNRIGRHY